VIEVRVGQNNSQYLATHISPTIVAADTIQLSKVIFERDKYVTLDILVLHHKESPPEIASFGKIAGINQIAVIDASAPSKPALWQQVLSGGARPPCQILGRYCSSDRFNLSCYWNI